MRRSIRLMIVAVMLVGSLAMSTVSASAVVPDENDNASCVGYNTSFFAWALGTWPDTNFGTDEEFGVPAFKQAAMDAEIRNFGQAIRGAAKNKPDSGCPFPAE